jgi:hypothetical protein
VKTGLARRALRRLDLRSSLAAVDLEGIEGVDPDMAFSMGMTVLDRTNNTANGIAVKLGGNREATEFGAGAISDPEPGGPPHPPN